MAALSAVDTEATGLDDGELARRIQAAATASPRWEAELVRRFAPRIRLYGRRHLRAAAAADDLVQAVLVVVIESLRAGKVREPDRLPSFVLGTCRMLAIEWKRGDHRRQGLLATFAADLVPVAAAADGGTSVIDHARLHGCLDGLSPRERTVVALTFYEDQGADGIAAQLGMTSGNVRVVRHRALERLARCLGAAEVAP